LRATIFLDLKALNWIILGNTHLSCGQIEDVEGKTDKGAVLFDSEEGNQNEEQNKKQTEN